MILGSLQQASLAEETPYRASHASFGYGDQKYPGDPKGRTYAELVAEGQYASARKGKTDAAREIADRLEGKAVQPIVGDNAANTSVTLNIDVVRKKLFGDDE